MSETTIFTTFYAFQSVLAHKNTLRLAFLLGVVSSTMATLSKCRSMDIPVLDGANYAATVLDREVNDIATPSLLLDVHNSLSSWRFPGGTCEAQLDHGFAAQPISSLVGLFITAYMILRFFSASSAGKSTATCVAVFSLVFESIVHLLSHVVGTTTPSSYVGMLTGGLPTHVAHYVMTVSTSIALGERAGHPKSPLWKTAACLVASLDLSSFLRYGISLYSLFLGLTFTAVLHSGYIYRLDNDTKTRFKILLVLSTVASIDFVNEYLNCEYMLMVLPIPPHAMAEIFLSAPAMYLMEKISTEARASSKIHPKCD